MFKTKMFKIKKRILSAILIWMVISTVIMPMFIDSGREAFAAGTTVERGDDDLCPNGTYPVVGVSYCTQENNPNMTKCPGSENLYAPKNGDPCPSEDASGASGESMTAQEALQKFMALILSIEKMLNKLLWPILFMIGGLLNNDILFGAGMEARLYDIWVPVRNIVNIIFVVALVGLALYSVLGINGENSQYSIKTMLPKLIAGIIAVNFSFIGIKVFLDAVNVFTTAIFAIPNQIEETKAPLNVEGGDKRLITAFCKEIYSAIKDKDGKFTNFDTGVTETAMMLIARDYGVYSPKLETLKVNVALMPVTTRASYDAAVKKAEELSLCKYDNGFLGLSEHGQAFFAKYESSNAALAMAINMGEIMFYKDVSAGTMGSGTMESLAINVIFSLLLYVVYAVSFGVLFVVLLARLVIMWIGLAMSPLLALSIAVPVAKEKFKLGDLTQKFVAHAIAPITIALVMTIGWIMLNAIKATMSDGGMAMGSKGVLVPALPIPGLETLQGLLISLATVAVVWIGVFMAADGTIASTITKGVQGQLQKFGSFIATAPIRYTPWVPVESKEAEGGKEMITLDALGDTMSRAQYALQKPGREKAMRLFPFGGERRVTADMLNSTTTKEELTSMLADQSINLKSKENHSKLEKAKNAIAELKRSGDPEEGRLAKMLEEGISGGETYWNANGDRVKAQAKKVETKQKKDKAAAAKKSSTTPATTETPASTTPAELTPETAIKDDSFKKFVTSTTGGAVATEAQLKDDTTTKIKTQAQLDAYKAVQAAAKDGIAGAGENSEWHYKMTQMRDKLKTQNQAMTQQEATSILEEKINEAYSVKDNEAENKNRKEKSKKWMEANWDKQ